MTGKKIKIYSFKAVIQYDGRDFHGWQKQTMQTVPTIQSTLENTIKKALNCEEVKTKASGRTDAGVHALAQVIKIDIPVNIAPKNLKKAINDLLPSSIKIHHCELSNEDFCPLRDAQKKEYRYYFHIADYKTEKTEPLSFVQERFTHTLWGEYDVDKMRQACQLLIGEYDFSHYYCEGTPAKSFVRQIFECELIKQNECPPFIQDSYVMRIQGSGFLKQMVRLIMGAIWEIGKGKLDLKTFEDSLISPEKVAQRHLAALAPANGLMLHRVWYDA